MSIVVGLVSLLAIVQSDAAVLMRRTIPVATDGSPSSPVTVPTVPSTASHWTQSEWVRTDPADACTTKAESTRKVTCIADVGGAIQPDSYCTKTRPDDKSYAEDMTGCEFAWAAGKWGEWSSNCSKEATRTRPVTCQKSDGTEATVEDCSETPKKPVASETSYRDTACKFRWTPMDVTGLVAFGTYCRDGAMKMHESYVCSDELDKIVGFDKCVNGSSADATSTGPLEYNQQSGTYNMRSLPYACHVETPYSVTSENAYYTGNAIFGPSTLVQSGTLFFPRGSTNIPNRIGAACKAAADGITLSGPFRCNYSPAATNAQGDTWYAWGLRQTEGSNMHVGYDARFTCDLPGFQPPSGYVGTLPGDQPCPQGSGVLNMSATVVVKAKGQKFCTAPQIVVKNPSDGSGQYGEMRCD